MDNVHTILYKGDMKEDKPTYNAQKAYDTVRQDGLWLKL